MAAAHKRRLTFPALTLLLCGAAVVVFSAPILSGALIYDRVAITQGEWWRLVTGNLVHYSAAHLVYDLLAFSITGTLIEQQHRPHLGLLVLLAASLIGAVLWFVHPELRYYGGLSGVATAAVVYLCLGGLNVRGAWRWVCIAALAALALKMGYESVTGESLTGQGGLQQSFIPVPYAHVAGALGALLLCGFFALARRVTANRR